MLRGHAVFELDGDRVDAPPELSCSPSQHEAKGLRQAGRDDSDLAPIRDETAFKQLIED